MIKSFLGHNLDSMSQDLFQLYHQPGAEPRTRDSFALTAPTIRLYRRNNGPRVRLSRLSDEEYCGPARVHWCGTKDAVGRCDPNQILACHIHPHRGQSHWRSPQESCRIRDPEWNRTVCASVAG